MRKILVKILTVSGLALLLLPSCKNNDPVVSATGAKIGTLNASTTSLALDRTRTSDPTTVVSFNFTASQYNFKAALVATNLEVDSVGDNWKNPQVIAITKGVYTQSYSTIDFDNLLLKIVPPDVASKVNVRIQYELSAYVSDYSNVITMDVTPFKATAWIWAAGDYEGWNNDGGGLDSLVSATGNGVYTGIINIPAGGTMQFKLLPVKGSWTVSYGDSGSGSALATGEAISTSGGNITAPSAGGQFLITANLNTNTITVVPADYYSVIGGDFSTAAWGYDYSMKFINDGTDTWTATVDDTTPSGGGFKVRQDDQWTYSWGLSGTTGTLTDNSGGNITVTTAGNYKVNFIMAPSPYGNTAFAASTPPVTTTYTITKQ